MIVNTPPPYNLALSITSTTATTNSARYNLDRLKRIAFSLYGTARRKRGSVICVEINMGCCNTVLLRYAGWYCFLYFLGERYMKWIKLEKINWWVIRTVYTFRWSPHNWEDFKLSEFKFAASQNIVHFWAFEWYYWVIYWSLNYVFSNIGRVKIYDWVIMNSHPYIGCICNFENGHNNFNHIIEECPIRRCQRKY